MHVLFTGQLGMRNASCVILQHALVSLPGGRAPWFIIIDIIRERRTRRVVDDPDLVYVVSYEYVLYQVYMST